MIHLIDYSKMPSSFELSAEIPGNLHFSFDVLGGNILVSSRLSIGNSIRKIINDSSN